MDLLLPEHQLPVMAFLPTFEDRWSLGMVNKKWHDVYKELLRPKNDTLASESLKETSRKSGRRGPHGLPDPGCTDPERRWFYDFEVGNHRLRCFCRGPGYLGLLNGSIKNLLFEITYQARNQWKITQRIGTLNGLPVTMDTTLHSDHGDIFDQVIHARVLFDAHFHLLFACDRTESKPPPTEEAWRKWTAFDPVLARRIYNFPYFVCQREKLEKNT